MRKFVAGQTYEAIWQDETRHTFKVIELGYGVYSDLMRILWDTGYEQSVYKCDIEKGIGSADEVRKKLLGTGHTEERITNKL